MGRATHHLAHFLVHFDGDHGRRLVTIVEKIVLLLDFQNIGMFGDGPERRDTFGLSTRQRHFLAQKLERFVHRLFSRIGFRVHNRVGNVLRNHIGPLPEVLRRSFICRA